MNSLKYRLSIATLAVLLSFAASSVQNAWGAICVPCPDDAGADTQVSASIGVFRSDGLTAVGFGHVSACETIKIRMSVAYVPNNDVTGLVNPAFQGGTMGIRLPNGSGGTVTNDVTPVGGVPIVGPASCGGVSPVTSQFITYQVTAADATAGTVDMLAIYSGGTALTCPPQPGISGTTPRAVEVDSCTEDGNVCNGVTSCDPNATAGVVTGVCSTSAPLTCNDNNVCTTDTCDAVTGCVYTPNAPCDDNNACTTDTCDAVSGCVFTPNAPCDDNNVCTTDTCVAATGCVFTPIAPCNDNNACTTDTCDSVTGCVFTPIAPCNDNNTCTTDTCDSVTGCVYTPNAPCNDNNACTTDTCDAVTGCVYTPNAPCNDNNACTTDTCDAVTGCVYTPNAPCNDNNACTTDTCDAVNGCVYTPNAPCNDNNACTTDTCDAVNGCVYTPNAPCNDNNACTTDTCDATTGCVYTAITCNDSNGCTTDTCDPLSGCVYTPISDCGCPDCVNPALGLGAGDGCTVLELGTGKVDITGPAGGIIGDVCIAPGGKVSMSGSEYITGCVQLGAGATFNKSGSGTVGCVSNNVNLSAEISAALAASSNAAALACTQTFVNLKDTTTIQGNGGQNVICVQNIDLSGGKQIVLNGGASDLFIINVTGKLNLSGGSDIVAVGVPKANVLINVIGDGPQVALSGGGGGVNCCAATIDGTVLAPQRKIALSPGLVNGQIISGKDISIVSGSSVRCPPCP